MKNEVRIKLFEMEDLKYKKFQEKICPNIKNIIGVRVPNLRKYAKEIAKSDFRTYLKNAKDDYYEEVLLQGMVIGISKMCIEEKLIYIEKFIPKIDNWAICDIFCSGLKFIKQNQNTMWQFLQKYIKSNKEFELRFIIVVMLDYFITDEYVRRSN